jgi:Mg2+-importing ATPase
VVAALAELGVSIKVISGDNRHVVAHLAETLDLPERAMLTGEALAGVKDEELWNLARRTALFVEVDPQQKERVVRALQRAGEIVGYLGDGVNDAPALYAADVGISVDSAVDVARESADVVLMSRELDVVKDGIVGGRRTFANTLKYICITTSANFGNVVSMALAAPVLPFLPMLPKQILLNNLLSDIPAVAISSDRVEPERIRDAQRWRIEEIQRFIVVFGLVSSLFDVVAFALLLALFRVSSAEFQTAWFVASLLTELTVILVLRTPGPAWRSRPSALLAGLVLGMTAAALTAPYLGSFARLFGFVPLHATVLASLVFLALAYLGATEAAKQRFFRPSASRSALPSD